MRCRATAVKLLQLFDAMSPIQCEIDAYGDFLQALGPKADPAVRQCASIPARAIGCPRPPLPLGLPA